MELEKKSKGAWLVHQSTKLDNVTSTFDLEGIHEAGKIGRVLGVLAGSEDVTMHRKQAEALAKANGVNALEFRGVLGELEAKHLVQVSDDQVTCLGLTSGSVLLHTSDFFDDKKSSAKEDAAIHLSELASQAPVDSKKVTEFLSDTYKLTGSETKDTLKSVEECGLIEFADLGLNEKLYFNGALFKAESPEKVQKILSSLSSADQVKLQELQTLLKSVGCVENDKAVQMLGQQLYDKVLHIGLIEVCEVNNTLDKTFYVMSPSAFNKFGNSFIEDTFDNAKALVASLTYGMTKSNQARGQIRMLSALMNKMIRGESVGPATAIGEDYRILEYKGVVKIERSSRGYMMTLLKKDVGEIALKILKQGDASEHSLSQFPSVSLVGFKGPEKQREALKKRSRDMASKTANELLRVIRTGSKI